MRIDESKALEARGYIEKYIRHTKGKFAGSPFILDDWQYRDIVRPVFGTVREDGRRAYKKVFVEIPRKNGKSEMGAAIALKLLTADQEPSAEIYSCAADKEQASAVYRVAQRCVEISRPLSRRCRIKESVKTIFVPKTNGTYKVVSADGRRQHGSNPHGVIFDEVHTQRTRALWDAMTTGLGTRSQPLIFAITTYGIPDEAPVWWELREYARQVREGIFKDPAFLSIHYGADVNDDFEDPRVWKKANPALGSFLSLESFKEDLIQAKRMPTAWSEFLRYNLNVLVQQAERWLPAGAWEAGGQAIDWNALRGAKCTLGLDLSSRRDITALVATFPLEDGTYIVRPWFFLPESNIPEKLRPWVPEFITPTVGDVVDYRTIFTAIQNAAKEYRVEAVHYDRFNAQWISNMLTEAGLSAVDVAFNIASMNGPTKEAEALIMERRVRHDKNPVMRWMADCVALRQDDNGNVMPKKPHRLKSEKRIDGVAAWLMSLMPYVGGRSNANSGSIWDEDGLARAL